MEDDRRRQLPAALSMIVITTLVLIAIFGGLYTLNRIAREVDVETAVEEVADDAEMIEDVNTPTQIVIAHKEKNVEVEAFNLMIHVREHSRVDDAKFSTHALFTNLSTNDEIGEATFSNLGQPQFIGDYVIRVVNTTELAVQFVIQDNSTE